MKKKKFEFGVTHFFIILLLIFGGSIWYSNYAETHKNETLKKMTSREIALMCTTDMATEYHIHPFLKINILGKDLPIPNNIGIINGCMNSIHTHDEGNGKLHVEAQVQKDFTLSDFFAVWKKEFNKNQVLDYKTDEKHKIRFIVDGKESQDYENLILKDAQIIQIIYEEIDNPQTVEPTYGSKR